MEAWKGPLESKVLRVNVKKGKMMSSSGNAGKVTVEEKSPFALYRKGLGSNSIFCQFCRCWMHKRYSGIKGKLK